MYVALLLLPLLAASAASAASAPVVAFKAQSKERVAAARTDLAAARAQMTASLDAFAAGLAADNFGTSLVDALLDDALEFGSTVVAIWTEQGEAIAQDGTDALEALAGVAPLGGHYPADLLAGGGGAFDKAVAKLEREVRAAVAAVQKRASRVEATAATSGFGVSLDFRVPSERTFSVPQEANQFADSGNNIRLDVYLIGGASRLGVDGDALIFGTGGTIGGGFVPELWFSAVSRDGTGATISDGATVTPIEDVVSGFDGWKAILDGVGSGLREGNWVVRAGDPSISQGVARLGLP